MAEPPAASSRMVRLLRRFGRAPVKTIRKRLRRLTWEIADAPYDRRLGVRTKAIINRFSGGPIQNAPCDPVPYRILAEIDRHMDMRGVAPPRFADLGTGFGRPLYFFARRFEELCGYEIVPEIHAMAVRQLERVRDSKPAFERISLVCADATVTAPLDQPIVLFLYHPFGPPPMARLCERLAQARDEVHIYYVNPVLADMIARVAGQPVDSFGDDLKVLYFRIRGRESRASDPL